MFRFPKSNNEYKIIDVYRCETSVNNWEYEMFLMENGWL